MDQSSLPLADTALETLSRIDSRLFPESIWKPHLGTNHTFINDLNRALSLEHRQQTYKHVNVLLLSWADNSLTDVDQEIQDLANVFEKKYGFWTVRWEIPSSRKPQYHLDSRLLEFLYAHDNPSELMIVYYGGHAGVDSEGETIWSAARDGPELVWSDCQQHFNKTEADILFIFDCCYAASSIRTRQTGKKEYLAACGKDSVTRGSGQYTFTKRFIKHLVDYSGAGIPFSILEIQARLVTDTTLKHSPIHAALTNPPESITLKPLKSPPFHMTQELKGVARAMISVQFSDTVQLDLELWQKWLTTHIPMGVGNVKLEGMFESGSKLVLFSLPVYEWGYLPENPAYTFVGLITSSNLLLNPTPAPSYLRPLQQLQSQQDEAWNAADTLEIEMRERLQIKVSRSSLEESRKSIEEGKIVRLLTVLAFGFIPVSYITSIFGMNLQEINNNGKSLWVFVLTALVLTALAIGLWALSNAFLTVQKEWHLRPNEGIRWRFRFRDAMWLLLHPTAGRAVCDGIVLALLTDGRFGYQGPEVPESFVGKPSLHIAITKNQMSSLDKEI